MKTIQYLILLAVLVNCAAPNKALIEANASQRMKSLDQDTQNNIHTLLEMIDEQAIGTDAGTKRNIPYEFKIPLDSRKKKQVHRIDPLISFTARTNYYQCIGENATKEKVLRIVSLPYAYKIKFCPYE